MSSHAGLAAGLERLAGFIDRMNIRIGDLANWLYPVLMVVVVANVVSRYGFNRGFIEFEEIQWHLYSVAFLLGMGFTYARNEQVRVDILYSTMSPRGRAWVDLLGCLFLLLPFAVSLFWFSLPYAWDSWLANERSEMPSGLGARYVIKGILSLGLLLLALQGLAVAIRNALFLAGYRRD